MCLGCPGMQQVWVFKYMHKHAGRLVAAPRLSWQRTFRLFWFSKNVQVMNLVRSLMQISTSAHFNIVIKALQVLKLVDAIICLDSCREASNAIMHAGWLRASS